jgi:hypothetical protein
MSVVVLEHLFVIAALQTPQPPDLSDGEEFYTWLTEVVSRVPAWEEHLVGIGRVSGRLANRWLAECLEATGLFVLLPRVPVGGFVQRAGFIEGAGLLLRVPEQMD